MARDLAALAFLGAAWAITSAAAEDRPVERQALFGDLHVHTRLSIDAWGFGVRMYPDDAYRFAKGEAIDHPSGYPIQLDRPLDFYAVTDHAYMLGIMNAAADPQHPLSQVDGAEALSGDMTFSERRRLYRRNYAFAEANQDESALESAWQRIVDAAERHYEPGRLTTFVAYEYTSGVGGNLHRNVVFADANVPKRPFSLIDSPNPEDLWHWMDEQRRQGMGVLAIPHNANKSNGRMFETTMFDGSPLTRDYAQMRMRNEPIVEVTQVKGTSETHPFLSPEDEWAGFEITAYRTGSWALSQPDGGYVRQAYQRGLAMQAEHGFNPYRFGLIGATDTHNAGGGFDESNFTGKIGVFDGTPIARGSVPIAAGTEDAPPAYARNYYGKWSASGLAGVWAEENTRESVFAAFQRKETFATSGPRIRVRFFAGYDLPDNLDDAGLADAAYRGGVPMGGDVLLREEGSPAFLAWATADPQGTRLQRLQIIKVWVDGRQEHEQVFDVACSDDLTVDPATHRCPDNGATVELTDCSTTPDVGATSLQAVWQDPGFRPDQHAAYYVRVLENPSCRWSTWDAVKAGVRHRPDLPATIQERAWSSPIWFEPDP